LAGITRLQSLILYLKSNFREMNTSSSSKRKLLPCIPDVSYHIQLVFILTFSYIWYNAINTDYLEDLSDKPQEYIDEIDVSPPKPAFIYHPLFILERKLVVSHILVHPISMFFLIPQTYELGFLRSYSEILESCHNVHTDLLLLRYNHDVPSTKIWKRTSWLF